MKQRRRSSLLVRLLDRPEQNRAYTVLHMTHRRNWLLVGRASSLANRRRRVKGERFGVRRGTKKKTASREGAVKMRAKREETPRAADRQAEAGRQGQEPKTVGAERERQVTRGEEAVLWCPALPCHAMVIKSNGARRG
jgi:hypothetical protein